MAFLDGLNSFLGSINPLSKVIGGLFDSGYKMWAQQKTWDREDTAVQRRVEDLKAAGLSPVLAAGSAAQTSSPIGVSIGENASAGPEAAVALMSAKKSMELSDADIFLRKQQAAAASFDAEVADKMRSLADESGFQGADLVARLKLEKLAADSTAAGQAARQARLAAEEKEWNLGLAKKHGIRSDIGGDSAEFANASDYWDNVLKNGPSGGVFTSAGVGLASKLLNAGLDIVKMKSIPRRK